MEGTVDQRRCAAKREQALTRAILLGLVCAALAAAQYGDYQQGLNELDAHQWQEAISSFKAYASRGAGNADAALYWMAYAQARNGESAAALETLALLRSKFPATNWLKDAEALEFEVRSAAGYPVHFGAATDAGLKLMAANKLMQSNPGKAFPTLEKVLVSSDPERVKEQALYVLAQTPTPEANKLLTSVAAGNSNLALQLQAIRLMGMVGNKASQKNLTTLYTLTPDPKVKSTILRSSTAEDSVPFLEHVAKTDLNPTMRVTAIQSLAALNKGGDSDLLVSVFETDKNPEVRAAVLTALGNQRNGNALITLAKQEKDPRVKAEIIGRMAPIDSKDVADYLTSVLK